MSEESDVFVRRHGAVAEIVLNRTAAHNALSTRLATEITAVVGGLDPAVRAVVLSSTSTVAFCVGADLKERGRLSDAEFMTQRLHFRDVFGALLNLTVPAVAAVHGFALGGGYELALCCDLIVADDTAVVGLPEVTLGIVPGGGGTQLVSRRAGYATAADLLFTGRRVDAAEAFRLRLVDRLVPAGPTGRPRWNWRRRSRPTRRSPSAMPRTRCAGAWTWTSRPASTSRTRRGGRPSSRPTGPRACARSWTSVPPDGPTPTHTKY
jgi:enoyl-CoA hydratase/carnithine racemase